MSEHQTGKRPRAWLPRVTVVMVVLVALLSAASFLQVRDIERGLLSVVADQQDGYVELVVGQINLKENRDDQEIIDEILGVLDENASQYWTFTRDGTMLYVRDVTETNRYRGLPSGTYFDDQSTEDFYEGLSTDRVTHAYVSVGGDEYIASGRAFEYKKGTYRLCLLTNESVVLDNNQLLGAKSRLGALLGIEAALLLFSTIWLAVHRDRKNRALVKAQDEVVELNGKLDRLNARISRERSYDTDARVWDAGALAQFEASLARRGTSKWLARVSCDSEEDAEALLARLKVLFGEEVARFRGRDAHGRADTEVCVLFLDADEVGARELLGDALGSIAARVDWSLVGTTEDGAEDEQEEA